MATVDATAITRIHDVEGSLTLTSIGGGAGGGANTEIFIQGNQSAGRKQSNTTDHGFWLTVTSADISGAGVHTGIWINHIHYAVVTKLQPLLGSTTANWHGHTFPISTYPAAGGWVRIWIDVSRTPEETAGTFSKAGLTQVGIRASLPAVGGNAPNLIMDASDFTTTGLLLTGTAGVFQDFVTADEGNGTNKYGVVVTNSGVIFCLARLTLGSASSLVFSDSGFVVVFPDQSLVASTFMGITADLQHASTSVTWTNGVVQSAGTVKGDLVVTGTSGSFTVSGSTLSALRAVTLTSACTVTGSSFVGCGTITTGGATLTNCTVDNSTASSAVIVASPANAELISNTDFISDGTGHGIEIGGTATDMTLSGVTFTGYGADDTTDAAIYVNIASGSMIISIADEGSTPSIRTAGATVTVQNAVTVKVTAKDADTLVAVQSARVLMEADRVATGTHTGGNDASTLTDSSKLFVADALIGYRIYNTTDGSNGPITDNDATTVTATLAGGTQNDWDTSDAYIIVAKPALNSVSITSSGTTATVTHLNHGLSTGATVAIRGVTEDPYNGIFTISNVSTNAYDYTMASDPPDSATGTPTSTAIILSGETSTEAGLEGILETTSYNFTINQPITGKVRRATSGTKYKTGTLTGTITSAGLDTTILLIPDE